MDKKQLTPKNAARMMLDGATLETKGGEENAKWGKLEDNPCFISWFTEKAKSADRRMEGIKVYLTNFSGWYLPEGK